MKLSVYFEGEFWVGVVEDVTDGKLRAARHVFGAEPKDAEVLEFVLSGMLPLLSRVSQGVAAAEAKRKRINPKRLARLAEAEIRRPGASELAKAALMLELQHRGAHRRILTREQKEADKERKREIARQKAKAKHRGR
ncbi:YjdF family protein [Paenibacillus ginsengihumi]|uniref:YjdF family protein n=1 Tax=Paenibacillus ginsengihumi TaxID=431596 RepID=UPI000378CCDE|nr:YjdF family protein [Paenibacillus ginsengihumi]